MFIDKNHMLGEGKTTQGNTNPSNPEWILKSNLDSNGVVMGMNNQNCATQKVMKQIDIDQLQQEEIDVENQIRALNRQKQLINLKSQIVLSMMKGHNLQNQQKDYPQMNGTAQGTNQGQIGMLISNPPGNLSVKDSLPFTNQPRSETGQLQDSKQEQSSLNQVNFMNGKPNEQMIVIDNPATLIQDRLPFQQRPSNRIDTFVIPSTNGVQQFKIAQTQRSVTEMPSMKGVANVIKCQPDDKRCVQNNSVNKETNNKLENLELDQNFIQNQAKQQRIQSFVPYLKQTNLIQSPATHVLNRYMIVNPHTQPSAPQPLPLQIVNKTQTSRQIYNQSMGPPADVKKSNINNLQMNKLNLQKQLQDKLTESHHQSVCQLNNFKVPLKNNHNGQVKMLNGYPKNNINQYGAYSQDFDQLATNTKTLSNIQATYSQNGNLSSIKSLQNQDKNQNFQTQLDQEKKINNFKFNIKQQINLKNQNNQELNNQDYICDQKQYVQNQINICGKLYGKDIINQIQQNQNQQPQKSQTTVFQGNFVQTNQQGQLQIAMDKENNQVNFTDITLNIPSSIVSVPSEYFSDQKISNQEFKKSQEITNDNKLNKVQFQGNGQKIIYQKTSELINSSIRQQEQVTAGYEDNTNDLAQLMLCQHIGGTAQIIPSIKSSVNESHQDQVFSDSGQISQIIDNQKPLVINQQYQTSNHDFNDNYEAEMSIQQIQTTLLSKEMAEDQQKNQSNQITSHLDSNPYNLRKMVMVSGRQSKTSKLTLNQNAIKFKTNIENEINSILEEMDAMASKRNKKNNAATKNYQSKGARYECIYKNLLRDIRQFYSQKFEEFQQEMVSSQFMKNSKMKYILFPLQILQFANKYFSKSLVEYICSVNQIDPIWFMKELAFTIGCFILPKYMIKSFQLSEQEIQSLTNKGPRNQKQAKFTKMQEQLQSGIDEVSQYIQDYPISKEKSKFNMITSDFYGILRDLGMEDRKTQVLQTYKLIFRFSIEKLMNYLRQDSFLLVILHYIKMTKMHRIHQRSVLCKNGGAYYRAFENMLNLSDKRVFIQQIIKSFQENIVDPKYSETQCASNNDKCILDSDQFEIVLIDPNDSAQIEQKGQNDSVEFSSKLRKQISLRKLQKQNFDKNIQIIQGYEEYQDSEDDKDEASERDQSEEIKAGKNTKQQSKVIVKRQTQQRDNQKNEIDDDEIKGRKKAKKNEK